MVILRARLIPTHVVRREFSSPPIIRDRAGAIRPDFSVCVESSCMLVGRTSTVIVAFLLTPGERKGSWGPLLRLSGKTDFGNLRWCLLYLLGLTRCEPVWLAQNVLLTRNCSGDLFRTVVLSYLFLGGGSHFTTQRLASRSAKQKLRMYVYIYIYIYISFSYRWLCSGGGGGNFGSRLPT